MQEALAEVRVPVRRQEQPLAADSAALQARAALQVPETPVGCVVVRDGQIIARGSNETNKSRNVSRRVWWVRAQP